MQKLLQKYRSYLKFRGKGDDVAKQYQQQIEALFEIVTSIFGSEQFVLKASKVDALALIRSDNYAERLLGLQRVLYNNPALNDIPKLSQIDSIIKNIEDMLADLVARKTIEESLERKVQQMMQKRQQKYLADLKKKVLREETGPETPETIKKYEQLERLEARNLTRAATEIVRPTTMAEILGQERAVRALLSKIASPFPQHIILYGPPGVGKTTAARLALEEARKLSFTPFAEDAPFVEVDGSTLRWDPREITNPLLGSVHDPIYQGARRDLAESGIPEPKPGLVTEAHGGILFIDEIGEVDPILQNKLLKVLEQKRVFFDSSYYDSSNPHVPKYIRKLFEDGAPADFVLIGATTRRPEHINPALRSRAAEIFFEPLTPEHIKQIVCNAAEKLEVVIDREVVELISEYTIEGRKAVNLLIDAYGLASYHNNGHAEQVTKEHLLEVLQTGRATKYVRSRASSESKVGRIFGLGVAGFLGSTIEIECAAFPAREKGKGQVRFNETAGTMAKDSVFNAAAVLRSLIDTDLAEYDVHVNVVGGGRIDGPSAGLAILISIYSALTGQPLYQDVAVTGEISIRGEVRAVGGVPEKIYGAQQAGIRKVLVPKENAEDVPSGLRGIEIVCVSSVKEALPHLVAVS